MVIVEGSRNLQKEIQKSDIVVVAVGHPSIIEGSWIKTGAVVIDCGINVMWDNKDGE